MMNNWSKVVMDSESGDVKYIFGFISPEKRLDGIVLAKSSFSAWHKFAGEGGSRAIADMRKQGYQVYQITASWDPE